MKSCSPNIIRELWIKTTMIYHSVQFSCSVVSDSLRPHELQHSRPPWPSPNPRVHSNSCPSSQWCHPAISSSVGPFFSCPQSLPASESFPMSQLFAWGGQSIGVSALASVLPKKSWGWSPSEWTGWISLQSKGLSRVFSNTTVHKHEFFGVQPSSQSNSHIHTWHIPKIQNIKCWWGFDNSCDMSSHSLLRKLQRRWFGSISKTINSFTILSNKEHLTSLMLTQNELKI